MIIDDREFLRDSLYVSDYEEELKLFKKLHEDRYNREKRNNLEEIKGRVFTNNKEIKGQVYGIKKGRDKTNSR